MGVWSWGGILCSSKKEQIVSADSVSETYGRVTRSPLKRPLMQKHGWRSSLDRGLEEQKEAVGTACTIIQFVKTCEWYVYDCILYMRP